MEVYAGGRWEVQALDHKKHVELEEIEIFSFSTQSLQVASKKPEFPEEPRIAREEVVLFGNDEYPCLLACDWRQGTARKCNVPLSCKMRSRMGVVEYEAGKFFLAGGCDWREKKSFSSCYLFDVNTVQIQETVKMSEKKHNFAIAAHQSFIYVFGGYDSHEKAPKKSCARFSLANESWDILPTLRRARNRCHAQSISADKIAVFGGSNGS